MVCRLDPKKILLTPEVVLQELSFKISNQRQAFIDAIMNQSIRYKKSNGGRGFDTVLAIDVDHAFLQTDSGHALVETHRLCLRSLRLGN